MDSQHAAEERPQTEARRLPDDEPPRERRAPAHADEARVRAVALRVHPEREAEPGDDAANEDEVEVVGAVGEAVEDVSQERGGAGEVQRAFVAA